MTVESAITFCLALLVWVIIPDPAVFAIVARSLIANLRSALELIAGILLGDLFYISIALFGLAAIGQILGGLFFVVKMLGAFYLVFLGLTLWFKDAKFNHSAAPTNKKGRYKSFLAGFSITLGNPKAILFHLGFLPMFFDLTVISVWDAFLIVLIFMIVLGSSLSIYAYAASKASLFFREQRRVQFLNRSAGVILICVGVAIATKK